MFSDFGFIEPLSTIIQIKITFSNLKNTEYFEFIKKNFFVLKSGLGSLFCQVGDFENRLASCFSESTGGQYLSETKCIRKCTLC